MATLSLLISPLKNGVKYTLYLFSSQKSLLFHNQTPIYQINHQIANSPFDGIAKLL